MEKKTMLWIIIAILIVAVLYIVFKSPGSGTGQVVSTAGQVASSSGMVGGC